MSVQDRDSRLIALVLLALTALLVLPLLTMRLGMMGGGMMSGAMWGSSSTASGWTWVVGLLFPVLLLGMIVALGYLVFRVATSEDHGEDAAMAKLREAYAQGDLSDEEYERRRERLQESDPRTRN